MAMKMMKKMMVKKSGTKAPKSPKGKVFAKPSTPAQKAFVGGFKKK